MSTKRRFLTGSLALLVLVFATTSRASAQVTEVQKVKGLISLIKSATKDCGKLRDWTAMTNPSQHYYIYTFSEAADLLSQMLKEGRIRKGKLGGGAKTCQREGIDSDVIVIDENVLSDMCSTNPATAGKAKMQLVGSLMNEMIHIIQKDSWAKRCELERDSDRGSLKLMCAILAALSKPDGTPHTNLTDIGNDKEKIPALVDCLKLVGITATTPNLATVLAAVHKKAKQTKERYKRRLDCFFNPIIANPADNWKDYYKNGGHRAATRSPKKVARAKVQLKDRAGTTTRDYVNPPGVQTTQSTAFENRQDQAVLITSTWTPAGDHELHWWIDNDDDWLPENPSIATIVIPGPHADPGIEGVSLQITDLQLAGVPATLIFHDLNVGSLWMVDLDTQGLPTGPVKFVCNDPALSAGGFEYFNEIWGDPTSARLVFSIDEPVGVHSGSPVVWVDWDPVFNVAFPNIGPGITEAQVLAPSHSPSIIDRDGSAIFQLSGNPGDFLTVDSVGHGSIQPLTAGNAGNDGITPLLTHPSFTQGNDYFLVSNGVDANVLFYPRLGIGADSATHDEDGDGTDDHVELTTSPGRLHLALGVPSAPPEVRQHLYELVLETPTPFHIAEWSATQRRITTDAGLLDFTRLPGSTPPLYVQSVHDFDGDTIADEAIIIRRQPQLAPGFFLELIFNVATAPFPVQQIPLGTLEPDFMRIDDFNGDGIPDVCITILDTPDLILAGSPSGNLVLDSPLYPGTGEDFIETVTINGAGCPIAQVHTALLGDVIDFNFNSPFGTFDGALNTIVLGQLFPQGGVLNPTFPGIAVDIFAPSPPFLIFNSIFDGPLGPLSQPLVPGGIDLHLPIPPSPALAGQALMLQAFSLDGGLSANGIFSSADGKEIRIN